MSGLAAIGLVVLSFGAGEQGARPPLPSAKELAELPADGGPRFNRLVFEKSPYLLQHAANPVDWYPWGEAAFERARAEGKPIFLSVGYSTCHWCHVMEHESFEDERVAALLNESFVAIKVDREERPDVDQVYMGVCQLMTGSGGWPLSIVMTPEKQPFFAGTYFPKESMQGRAGMVELLPAIAAAWKNEREKIVEHAADVVSAMRSRPAAGDGELPGAALLARAAAELAGRYDRESKGFGGAPKFPVPHQLSFLLRWHRRSGDAAARAMVEETLAAMRRGGIYDQLGHGFHRYSTDRRWLVPHFEKMLYDQALQALAYTEAFEVARALEHERTAREVLDYVLRDLGLPEGGFASAEDADSEGREGAFYLWRRSEILSALGEEEGAFFAEAFGVTEPGNFADPHHPELTGLNVLHLPVALPDLARRKQLAEDVLRARLEVSREKLFQLRACRPRPLRDDKVLVDWNGLAIGAFARAARAFDEPRYAAAARRAADFLWQRLRGADGRLKKRWRQGEAAFPAVLDDYAFFVFGLIELYQASFEPVALERALALNATMLEQFGDDANGALFLAPKDGEALIVRSKEVYDGALPSGNSVAAENLLRLAHLTGRMDLAARGEGILKGFSAELARSPSEHTRMMIALDFDVGPASEVVIAGEPESEGVRAMLRALRERFLPNVVVLLRPEGEARPEMVRLAPFLAEQRAIAGRATAYVCRAFACDEPKHEIEELVRAVEGVREP